MGRRNSKRRILEGKEGWTPAKGIQEEASKRMCCRACGAHVSKTRFHDKHRWTEACAKPPPDTAALVTAGCLKAPLTTYRLVPLAHQPDGAFEGELRELLDADGDADSDAEGIVAGVVEGNPSDDSCSDNDGEGDAGARYDFSTGTSNAQGKNDDGKSANATLMEAALNLREWKLNHNIKTAAFERLLKLLKTHMLPKNGSELAEMWYQMKQCLNVPDIRKCIVHCCPCDEHRYGHSKDGDWSYDRCPRCNLPCWTPESLRHPRPATSEPRKFKFDFNVCELVKQFFWNEEWALRRGTCRDQFINEFWISEACKAMDAATNGQFSHIYNGRNMKVLIIIPGPFAPKHIDIYVEETLKAIAITQSAEGAQTVHDVYEVTDSDGNKFRARRDLQHQVCAHGQHEVGMLAC
eukprot:jgi/Tetstr1/421708/TSEL_012646.t1